MMMVTETEQIINQHYQFAAPPVHFVVVPRSLHRIEWKKSQDAKDRVGGACGRFVYKCLLVTNAICSFTMWMMREGVKETLL